MMDIPMIDSYLESLAGYIHDDDKLVTYKWLSKELEVHVNIAKLILWRYWEKHKNDELVATFMLIGNLKTGGMRVEVVKDCDLEKAKEKFEKIISEHVYSLQKTLLDIELLATAGKGDSKYSAITCEKSVVMDDEELLRMRWGKAIAGQVASAEKKVTESILKKEAPILKEAPKKIEENDIIETKENNGSENKAEEKPGKKISPPTKPRSNDKKGKKPIQSTKVGFGNLFGKVANQKKTEAAPSSSNGSSDTAKKESTDSSPDTILSKSEADNSLFKEKENKVEEKAKEKKIEEKAKQNKVEEKAKEKKVEENSKDKKAEEKAKENSKSSKSSTQKHSRSSSPERSIPSKSAPSEKSKKPSTSKTSKSKKPQKTYGAAKRNRSQDSQEQAKKRKRIVVASDSSDESEAASECEDIFDSPPQPPPKRARSPTPPVIQQEGNKRKIRKLVDKTFEDEDGFLITKKVQVYESCSEEEAEIVAEVAQSKKQPEPERPKASKDTKPNVKKKQMTMMNFFKKA